MQTMPWVSSATVWASANRSSGPAASLASSTPAASDSRRSQRTSTGTASSATPVGAARAARRRSGHRVPSAGRRRLFGRRRPDLHRDRRGTGGARRPHEGHGVAAPGADDEDEAAAVLVGLVLGIDDGQAADRHVEARGRGQTVTNGSPTAARSSRKVLMMSSYPTIRMGQH